MYAGRHACCPLVSYVEYVPRVLLRSENGTDRRTEGRQTVTLRLPLDVASLKIASITNRHTVLFES